MQKIKNSPVHLTPETPGRPHLLGAFHLRAGARSGVSRRKLLAATRCALRIMGCAQRSDDCVHRGLDLGFSCPHHPPLNSCGTAPISSGVALRSTAARIPWTSAPKRRPPGNDGTRQKLNSIGRSRNVSRQRCQRRGYKQKRSALGRATRNEAIRERTQAIKTTLHKEAATWRAPKSLSYAPQTRVFLLGPAPRDQAGGLSCLRKRFSAGRIEPRTARRG